MTGIVKGPYSPEDWLTMKMYKFGSIPHLLQRNKQFNGRYELRIKHETKQFKEYLQKESFREEAAA